MPSFLRANGTHVDAANTLGREHVLHPYVSRRHVGIKKAEKSKLWVKILHRNGAAKKNGDSSWSFLPAGSNVILCDGDEIALHVPRPLRLDPVIDAEHVLTFCGEVDSDETVGEE